MITAQQQKAIDYITKKFQSDPQILALLISGSIAHGFNDENSDVDFNAVVSNDFYESKKAEYALTYYEGAEEFYKGGYFDGKFITLDYLSLVAERGNDPTRFALHDAVIAFDKTGCVEDYLKKISIYGNEKVQENTIRFLSQMDGWKWYCEEAIKKQNQYLLDTSITRLILFAGRLILLDNRIFFPYHKWLIKTLENAPNKPNGFMEAINRLLADKTIENVNNLYNLVKEYKAWNGGVAYSWSAHFLHDVETIWMRENEFIENL